MAAGVQTPTKAALVVLMTAIFIKMHPKPDQVVVFRDTSTEVADPHARNAKAASLASRVERSMLGTLLLLALGAGYVVMTWHFFAYKAIPQSGFHSGRTPGLYGQMPYLG